MGYTGVKLKLNDNNKKIDHNGDADAGDDAEKTNTFARIEWSQSK